jgi:hypothetical protein
MIRRRTRAVTPTGRPCGLHEEPETAAVRSGAARTHHPGRVAAMRRAAAVAAASTA